MRRGSFRALAADRDGATAVEFALVVGPLLLLLFGTAEFGRLLWTREALHSTAIAGARCMGVKQSDCAPGGAYSSGATLAYVQERALNLYVSLPTSAVALNASATCAGTSGFSEVLISYTFESVIPGILDAFSLADITATACFPNQT